MEDFEGLDCPVCGVTRIGSGKATRRCKVCNRFNQAVLRGTFRLLREAHPAETEKYRRQAFLKAYDDVILLQDATPHHVSGSNHIGAPDGTQ